MYASLRPPCPRDSESACRLCPTTGLKPERDSDTPPMSPCGPLPVSPSVPSESFVPVAPTPWSVLHQSPIPTPTKEPQSLSLPPSNRPRLPQIPCSHACSLLILAPASGTCLWLHRPRRVESVGS